MKEARIEWTAFALSELDSIYEYLAGEASTDQAFQLIRDIFQRTSQLSRFPESGQEEELLKEQGSRYLVEGTYKIIYQLAGEKVIITDVFHTSRNPEEMKADG